MDNIIDIKQLSEESAKKMKTKELKQFAEAQQLVIDKLQKENSLLKEKCQHLETMLKDSMRNNIVMELSPEEVICIEQINLLKQKSKSRDLTLEETKKLDLLVKNLKIIREETTVVVKHTDVSNVKEAELVAIATGRNSEE